LAQEQAVRTGDVDIGARDREGCAILRRAIPPEDGDTLGGFQAIINQGVLGVTKAKTRATSDDYAVEFGSLERDDFVGIKPLVTPPKIRRERTRLIEILAERLRDYDVCVRALAKDEIPPRTLSESDFGLALAINQLCYFDEEECEVRGEYYSSQKIIRHYEGKAKVKAGRKRKAA
jgi:hypothetical protein